MAKCRYVIQDTREDGSVRPLGCHVGGSAFSDCLVREENPSCFFYMKERFRAVSEEKRHFESLAKLEGERARKAEEARDQYRREVALLRERMEIALVAALAAKASLEPEVYLRGVEAVVRLLEEEKPQREIEVQGIVWEDGSLSFPWPEVVKEALRRGWPVTARYYAGLGKAVFSWEEADGREHAADG